MPPEAMMGIFRTRRAAGNQHEVRGIFLARVAGAFEAVDADRIDAGALCTERVPYSDTLVHNPDAVVLELTEELPRHVARRFNDAHTAVDDGVHVVGIWRGLDRGQHGDIHAEGSFGHAAAAVYLLAQMVGCRLGQSRQDAQAAGV